MYLCRTFGIEKQWHLFNFLKEKKHHCIVLDSNEILKAPEKVLCSLCDALEIPFYKEMLHWEAGSKKRMVFGQSIGMEMFTGQQVLKNKKQVTVHCRNISNPYATKAKNITTFYINIQ
jgi:hypothetical protein